MKLTIHRLKEKGGEEIAATVDAEGNAEGPFAHWVLAMVDGAKEGDGLDGHKEWGEPLLRAIAGRFDNGYWWSEVSD